MKKSCKTCGWSVWPKDGRGRILHGGDCTYPAKIPQSYTDYSGNMPKKRIICGDSGKECGGWSIIFT